MHESARLAVRAPNVASCRSGGGLSAEAADRATGVGTRWRWVRLRTETEAGRVVLRWGTWSGAAGARWRSRAGGLGAHARWAIWCVSSELWPVVHGRGMRPGPRLASGSRIGPSRRLAGAGRGDAPASARRARHRHRGPCGPLRRLHDPPAWVVACHPLLPWHGAPHTRTSEARWRVIRHRYCRPGRRRQRAGAGDQTEARSRRLMSAHSSHTDAGMTPVRISSENT